MLRNTNSLTGYMIHAADGELGEVDEFCFDDKTWDIRYLVVKTGNWLFSRKVLISTAALKTPDWRSRSVPVALTREQVRNSPDIDTDKTVTRRHELELHQYYGWPLYWGEGFYAATMSDTSLMPEPEADGGTGGTTPPEPETHLQGTREVTGYRLRAADGLIGHVEDFIVDDSRWRICYLVVGTGTWLSGRKVLVSPHWIERVDWATSEVFVDLTKLAVQASPPYDPAQPVSEDYESELYDHYGRPRPEKMEELAAAARGGKK